MRRATWKKYGVNIFEWNLDYRIGKSIFSGEQEYNPALSGIDKLRHQNLRGFRRFLK